MKKKHIQQRKRNKLHQSRKLFKKGLPFLKGFTLIELVVTIAVISVLMLALILTFNPITQLNKAKDGQRQANLQQIKIALDTYYNDNNCYPSAIPFGSAWTNAGSTYMAKVPQDPDYPSNSYYYQPDQSSCPQSAILYASFKSIGYKMEKFFPPQAYAQTISPATTVYCQLTKLSNCLPQNYTSSGYNACIVEGSPNCGYIAQTNLPLSNTAASPISPTTVPVTIAVSPTPTPTLTITQPVSPTPTSIPGTPTPTCVPIPPCGPRCELPSVNYCPP